MAWLLAALISYMLLLQGAVSAYAKGAMAVHELGPTFIICSPSGEDYSDISHPLAGFALDCCSSLCQFACASAPADLPETAALAATHAQTFLAWTVIVADFLPPSDLGLVGEARAPPAFSA